MTTDKKQTSNMNTILSINFMDIKIPKVRYLIFIENTLYRITHLDYINNDVTLKSVFTNNIEHYKISDIKDKFIKFISIHHKITHSIQHTCIDKVLNLIKYHAEDTKTNPDSIVYDIINNKIHISLLGKVVPCYIYPLEGDKIVFISDFVISNFKLDTPQLRLGTILFIQRSNKNTTYTIKKDILDSKSDIWDIMCDRSDFKLLGKKDRKDLFYVL